MPIYEYRCPDGHTFEVFQRMADDPIAVCEVCGKSPVEKVLYPVAVHYKGSGFYSTDYGKGSRKPTPPGKEGGGKEGGGKEGGGGESSSSGDKSSSESSSSSDGGTSTSTESKPAKSADS